MTSPITDLFLADSLVVMQSMPNECVDLIITSPPYADQRKKTYGGIHPDHYVDWFRDYTKEMHRILQPTGSFVLNIKEKVVNGQRHRYVNHLIDVMVDKQDWMWTEEYMWHKRNCTPGKWPNRFRDAWESCHHFTKQKKFAMYQEEVMVPVGDWSKSRLSNLSDTDKKRDDSATKSGFGKKISNWVGRDKVFPANVLHLATECSNSGHSAAFPYAIPEWFIKLFSAEGDLVLDPFMGSGTALLAARDLKRDYIGVDNNADSYNIAVARMAINDK